MVPLTRCSPCPHMLFIMPTHAVPYLLPPTLTTIYIYCTPCAHQVVPATLPLLPSLYLSAAHLSLICLPPPPRYIVQQAAVALDNSLMYRDQQLMSSSLTHLHELAAQCYQVSVCVCVCVWGGGGGL